MKALNFLALFLVADPSTIYVRGQADFFLLISNTDSGQGAFRCGASLIHDDIGVTAGGCAFVGDVVRVGYKSDTESFATRTVAEVGELIFKGHLSAAFPDDIEVFRLNEPVPDVAIKINRNQQVPQDRDRVFYAHAGHIPDLNPRFKMGDLPLTDEFVETLQTGQTRTVQFQRECQDAMQEHHDAYVPLLNSGTQLCARSSPAKGPCDSSAWGSPLWVTDDDDEPVLVGIASQGSCDPTSPPYVYTRTFPYLDFVEAQVCALSLSPPDYCL